MVGGAGASAGTEHGDYSQCCACFNESVFVQHNNPDGFAIRSDQVVAATLLICNDNCRLAGADILEIRTN